MPWLRILATLTLGALLSSCGDQGPIRLGFIGGLSGRFADLGSSGRNGAMVAVDWRNARGGVAGRPIVLLIRDDEHLPATARNAFRSLIDENVIAVVGPMTSAMATEILPLAEGAKTVLVGGTIVSDRFSGKDDFLIRVISGTREYAAQTARQIHQIAPAGQTEVFYDLANRDYAEEWARNFALEAARLGNPAIHLHSFDSARGGAAAASAATVLGEHKVRPHEVVLVCSAHDAVAIARVARQMFPGIRLTSSAWAGTEQLLEEDRQAVEGMVLQQYHNVDDNGETFRAFSGEFQQRFGRKPDYAAVVAFDAMNLLLDALENHPRRAGLRETIIARKQFSGLSGLITLDANGDAERPFFAAVVKNGRFAALNTQATQASR